MIDREDALHNLAKYNDKQSIIFLYQQIHNLYNLSFSGNQTALCIYLDLKNAMNDDRLTKRQQECLRLKFWQKENNVYIAEQLNIDEKTVRNDINGAIKRIIKILNN